MFNHPNEQLPGAEGAPIQTAEALPELNDIHSVVQERFLVNNGDGTTEVVEDTYEPEGLSQEQLDEDGAVSSLMGDAMKLYKFKTTLAELRYQRDALKSGKYATGAMGHEMVTDKKTGGPTRQDKWYSGADIEKADNDKVAEMEKDLKDRLTALAQNGNTSRILATFQARVDAQTGRAAPAAAREQNVRSRHRDSMDRTRRAAGVLTRHSGTAPDLMGYDIAPPGEKPREREIRIDKLREIQAEHASTTMRRSYIAATSSVNEHADRQAIAGAASANIFANGVERDNGSGTIVRYLESYGTDMDNLAADVRRDHEATIRTAERQLDEAVHAMESWALGTENITQEVETRTHLDSLAGTIDGMSHRDDARAILLEGYLKQRFRFEHRRVLVHAGHTERVAGAPALMTADGGIFLNANNGAAILYEDGSLGHYVEDQDGNQAVDDNGDPVVMRYHTDGRAWTGDESISNRHDVDFSGSTDAEVATLTADVYTQWDEDRTPDIRAHAIAHFEEHTGRVSAGINQFRDRIHTANAGIDARNEEILQQDAIVRNPDASAAEQSAAATRITDLRTEITGLHTNIADYENEIGNLNEVQNDAMYKLGFLRAAHGTTWRDRVNDVNEFMTDVSSWRWRSIMSRMGFMAAGHTVESGPQLRSNGTVHWNGVTLNGEQGDWDIRPNGESRRFEADFDPYTGAPATRKTNYDKRGNPGTPYF